MRNAALWLDTKLGLNEHTIAHYAWVIVAIAGVVQMVGAAIRMAFGVLVDPLVETFGWSPGSIGLAYALMSVVTALSSPIAGYLGNRFGARNTMLAGTILFFIGMMWTSQNYKMSLLLHAHLVQWNVCRRQSKCLHCFQVQRDVLRDAVLTEVRPC